MANWWKNFLYKIGWYDTLLTPKGADLLHYLYGVLEDKRQPYNEDYEEMLNDDGRDRKEVAEELIDILENAQK